MSNESPGKLMNWATRAQPWLILLAGLIYWGLYLRYWFNPHDEGGTAAVTAMRILGGERPMRDISLGYNVLWFYPIVGLFKIGGVNYLTMRAYFFALSACSALAGWAVVRRVTGRSWWAFAIGLLLVLFPGSQFKNYIPLLGVLNTLCLIRAASRPSTHSFFTDTLLGAAVLGLSYLIRIDLAIFFSVLWMVLLLMQLLDNRLTTAAKGKRLALGLPLLAATVLACHLPVYAVARAQGFDQPFLQQYTTWIQMLGDGASSRLKGLMGKPTAVAAPEKIAPVSSEVPKNSGSDKKTILPRSGLADFRPFENFEKSALVLLTYLPLLSFAVFLGWATVGTFAAWRAGRFTTENPSFLLGIVVAGSLTTFPQFFFFRPDRPHLSEFMVGFLVLLGCGSAMLWQKSRQQGGAGRWLGPISLSLLSLHLALYGWFALDHASAGTIAARFKRKSFFAGSNGVQVYASKKEAEQLSGVRNAILEHSQPGDFLICYPYQPGYNLMTDRPTYERDLYMDNATQSAGWGTKTIASLQQKKPAVVVIDDRPINGTENSRFSAWAPDTYAFIKSHYQLVGTFNLSEVYALAASPPPLSQPPQSASAPQP